MALGTFLYPWGKRRFTLKTLLSSEKPNYQTSINQKTNPILNIALLDPEFNSLRVNNLYQMLNGILSYENQSKFLNNIYSSIDNTVYKDRKKII